MLNTYFNITSPTIIKHFFYLAINILCAMATGQKGLKMKYIIFKICTFRYIIFCIKYIQNGANVKKQKRKWNVIIVTLFFAKFWQIVINIRDFSIQY